MERVALTYILCCYLVAKLFLTLFRPPWTVVCQAPLSKGFPRQEYWKGLPFRPSEHLPDPGLEPASPASQVDSLPCVKQLASGKLLCDTGSSARCSVMTWRGGVGGVVGKLKKEGYMYTYDSFTLL